MDAHTWVALPGMGRALAGPSWKRLTRCDGSISSTPNRWDCDNSTGSVATLTWARLARWKSSLCRTSMR
jgi:hypothetical protein